MTRTARSVMVLWAINICRLSTQNGFIKENIVIFSLGSEIKGSFRAVINLLITGGMLIFPYEAKTPRVTRALNQFYTFLRHQNSTWADQIINDQRSLVGRWRMMVEAEYLKENPKTTRRMEVLHILWRGLHCTCVWQLPPGLRFILESSDVR